MNNSAPLRVAVIEMARDDLTATGDRGRAIRDILVQRGCHVDVMAPHLSSVSEFARLRFSLWSRLKRRALRRKTLPHLWDYLANELVPKIRRGHYDVVIGRNAPIAYVLAQDVPGLKILDMANVTALELYHSSGWDDAELIETWEKEQEIIRSADVVCVHHSLLERFIRKYIIDDPKIITVRMGCDAFESNRRARYCADARFVYAGSYYYFQDPFLLSWLTKISPFPIDCYGSRNPQYPFLPHPLNYRGFGKTLGFLADYQAGVITVSQDRLRRHSPSTKFAYYFSAGLPVLFPEWMMEGHEYEAAVPYTEDNFCDVARALIADPVRWQRLSDAALVLAGQLRWDKVLQPLADIIQQRLGRELIVKS
jgi:hypothetical protein